MTETVPRPSNHLHSLKKKHYKRHVDEAGRWIWTDVDPHDALIDHVAESEGLVLPDDIPPPQPKLSPILLTLLAGTRDEGSPLRLLRGHEDVWRLIWQNVVRFWDSHVLREGVFASKCCKVEFPEPTGLKINMMPIILGESYTVPYPQYLPMLACVPISRSDWGRTGYLTIHESTVNTPNTSQRRGGLHTETPGRWKSHGEWAKQEYVPLTVAWGRGYHTVDGETGHYQGGLFMASNVSNSTRVWNLGIDKPEDVVGELGDLEHLRPILGPGATLKAGELCWMTDCTPHESLPLPQGTRRQYFRLVTSEVSVWYEDHSTPNPLGVEVGEGVKVIKGNKFE